MVLVTINERVLESCFGRLENRARGLIAELDAAFEDMQQRESTRLAEEIRAAGVAIRQEIQAVIDGKADPTDNVLKNAPHTASAIASADWTHPYSREQAVFPLPFVRERKFWPSVGRIDNPYGLNRAGFPRTARR